MNASLESLFAWLFDFSGLATALLVAAIVLRWVLRDPASRVTLAWGTWLAILAGGILLALPSWPRIDAAGWFAAPVQQPPDLLADDSAGSEFVYLSNESLASVDLPLTDSKPVLSTPALSPEALGARIWLLVAAVAIGWLAIGLVRAWRLIASSQTAPPWTQEELRQIVGLRRRRLPGLLTSKQVATALALGTLRPRIVLPLASAAESNAPAVRAALAHEWAHIAAGDLWLLALERSLLPLLALHPLFWWLRRLTRLDQELAADAAAAGDKPAEYAEALLDWAKGEPHRRPGVAALAMWERPSNLSRRIAMILDPKRSPSARRGRLSAYAVLALLFTLALGLSLVSWRPMAAQDDPAAESADSPARGDIRVFPLIGPARLTRTLPAPPAEGPAIMIEMQLLSLDPATGAHAVTIIRAANKDRASVEKPEGGLAWAELNLSDSEQLVESLQSVRGTTVTAHPKLVTQNGREATIVVGGEIPIVAVDETVNGEQRDRRVEFKEFGTRFRVKPQILAEDPRMVVLEIAGEHTDRTKAADPTGPPLLKSQKIELAATIELGKSLVLLATAPEMRVVKGGADIKDPENKRLLILLRPSVVEHKYVEVYPDPNAATRTTAARTRYTQLATGEANEAKLAEQLRSIRQAVEELAREREASRQENAALRAELEQLRRSQRPSAAQEFRGDAQYFRAVLQPGPRVTQVYEFTSAGEAKEASDLAFAKDRLKKLGASFVVSNNTVTITGHEAAIKELGPVLAAQAKLIGESVNGPGPAQPQPATALALPVPMGQPAAQVTKMYVFHGNKQEAENAAKTLAESLQSEDLRLAIDLKANTLTVVGTPSAMQKVKPVLPRAGNVTVEFAEFVSDGGAAKVVADPNTPQAAVQRGIEWLRAHHSDAQWQTEPAAKGPTANQHRTYRKLLELDLQAAELELQGAQEDFEAAQQLNKQNAISAEELRMKRRAVDRTKIQVARLKVMLEAEEEQPETAPGAASPK